MAHILTIKSFSWISDVQLIKMTRLLPIIVATICWKFCSAVTDPNLPPDHLDFYLKTSGKCWGYEEDCKPENSFSKEIECETEKDPYSGRISRDIFYDEADFGYVRTRLGSMMSICEPRNSQESSLVCSKHLQFCAGRKIFIDFEDLVNRKSELLRYRWAFWVLFEYKCSKTTLLGYSVNMHKAVWYEKERSLDRKNGLA
jgi:hypothetical protein